MKKFSTIALAALMVTALTFPTSAANSFEAATGTPTIDGKMDDAYKAAPEIAINVMTSGDGKTSGTARVLWDSNNIYVFFDITDPVFSTEESANYYESDSVEFFLNLTDKKDDVTKINAGQYTAEGPIEGAKFGWQGRGMHWDANKDKATYKSVKTDKGYAVEMQIPFGADYTPKAGAQIGVAFHINSDEDGKSGREGEYFAGQDQSQAWSKTDSYDTLTLTDKKYEAPKKDDKAAATADMGIVAGLAALASSGAAFISLKKRK